jgi:hypothetical protein
MYRRIVSGNKRKLLKRLLPNFHERVRTAVIGSSGSVGPANLIRLIVGQAFGTRKRAFLAGRQIIPKLSDVGVGMRKCRRADGQLSRIHEAPDKPDCARPSGYAGSRGVHIRWGGRKPNRVLDLRGNGHVCCTLPRVRRIHDRSARMLHVDY